MNTSGVLCLLMTYLLVIFNNFGNLREKWNILGNSFCQNIKVVASLEIPNLTK